MQRHWRDAALTLAATALVAGGALAQGFGFGFGPPGGGGGGMLLRMPQVQTELKLTDGQKAKLDEVMAKIREERRSAFQDLQGQGPEAFQKKMAEWQASEEKQVNAILNADQQQRYHQLQLQRQGITAVADKPVADALKLSDEQRTRIQAVLDEQRQSMRALFQNGGPRGFGGPGGPGGPPPGGDGGGPGFGPGGPGGPPPGGDGPGAGPGGPGGPPRGFGEPSKMEAIRKQTEDKITALLTDDQKKQWKEMLGAPFTFPAFRPGGRGGPRGFGGPGGPGGPPQGDVRQGA